MEMDMESINLFQIQLGKLKNTHRPNRGLQRIRLKLICVIVDI